MAPTLLGYCGWEQVFSLSIAVLWLMYLRLEGRGFRCLPSVSAIRASNGA